MGGEQVKVNLDRLDQVIGELAGFDKEIEQQIATLMGRVAALHTRWEGEAAAKHVEAQAEWTKGGAIAVGRHQGLAWCVLGGASQFHRDHRGE
ncbi:WXG100 family type VII secretion target [Mycobacteroides abscessus]|uniref:WXG100 family type VII secretion target n=1 Tax=Mycobacteroides abscessus TaxID=36809 RepID=UPI0027D9D833|nr:WXG100 family type VII secretion target [Mycobacteroides abscessus]